jgi:hypothetical protein
MIKGILTEGKDLVQVASSLALRITVLYYNTLHYDECHFYIS